MNTVEPPGGGVNRSAGMGSPPPVAVQQTTVIQMGSQKSVAAAVLLALFFGPLGMLYATVSGALIMFGISFVIAIVTLGLGLLFIGPICAIWAGIAANSYNNRLQGMSTHQVATNAATVVPAAWHDDPQGSGRLRYYDGMRWTDHYADHSQQQDSPAPVDPPTKQLEAAAAVELSVEEAPVAEEIPVAEEEPGSDDGSEAPTAIVDAESQQVFCGACGNQIAPTARFCPACGETQSIA
jgi:hypothetical protein